jgi:general stress protein YciG
MWARGPWSIARGEHISRLAQEVRSAYEKRRNLFPRGVIAPYVGEKISTKPFENPLQSIPADAPSEPKRPKPRGFAAMDPAKVSEIARKGGKAAHAAGTAHEFTPEEARVAGKKGGARSALASRHPKGTAEREAPGREFDLISLAT